MTFRQILGVLWQRRILIVAVVVLAFVVAVLFLYRQTPVYSSSAVVRLSGLSTSAAATSGQIGTSQVDFDPESVASPAVLSGAAKLAGEANPDALDGQVTYVAGEGTQANRLTITATGPTASSAQSRTEAVAKSYNEYLQKQLTTALAAAKTQAAEATTNAEHYQTQVDQNPANSIAQSNLASALQSLGSANTLITRITNSGPPLTILTAAEAGAFQGVSPLIAVAVALVAGLLAGIGIALVRDQFDNRLRDEHEIKELTGVASLGELSFDKRVARGGERLPAAERKRTPLNEGLRALRTTLQVLLPSSGGIVVFTSVEPGDGKTFLSANLALVWARTGKKVILVSGDLRRPGLGEYYGEAADGRGLTDLLQSAAHSGNTPSQAAVERMLNDTSFRGLRILPSGAEPHAPADLLATAALGSVFESLRALSDIVVVDSPPSMALVDASLLTAKADGAVLVTSVRRTDRGNLIESVRGLNSNDAIVLGVVANRSRRHIPRSYGAYYGRSKNQRSRKRPIVAAADRLADTEAFTDAEELATVEESSDAVRLFDTDQFPDKSFSTEEGSDAVEADDTEPAGEEQLAAARTRKRKPRHPATEESASDDARLPPDTRGDG